MERSDHPARGWGGLPIRTAVFGLVLLLVLGAGCSTTSGVQSGDTVRVYYTVSFPGTEPFESNVNGTPLEFVVGDGTVIRGFDQALIGMNPGETKTVTVSPEDGYGLRNETLVKEVDTATALAFIQNLDRMGTSRPRFFPGMEPVFEYTFPGDIVVHYTFYNISEESTTIDQNHPLAGKDLVFTITLEEIVKK
ncbi:MAG: FKBP-type peptidyl-prolyl cis-trans isomerase [Methanoregulaceae archaeon PtaB.Bin056]|jgi:peptidylprolyl isomerase|nr:MAG: FKBP-type peptidyl-prolyl cis-trans isomerase [Methanoregulaceae archaeon PtaB.Bin056]